MYKKSAARREAPGKFLILRIDPVAMPLDQSANPSPGDGSPGEDSKGAQPLDKTSAKKLAFWKGIPILENLRGVA
ncbi:MAG: hypothetical protein LBF34_00925 [Puniceicoccales bacterium]|nr:hypothetical protein [Puniceicoccales bacterium]